MSSSFTGKTNSVTLYFITNEQIRQRNNSPIVLRVYFTQEKILKLLIICLEEINSLGQLKKKDFWKFDCKRYLCRR